MTTETTTMSEKVEHKPARERHEPRTERTEHAPEGRTEHAPERREERPRVERPRGQIPPDTVFIGKKPLMAYATAVMMHFNSGQNVLTVKARGQSISHAVDVVEVVRRRFFQGKLTIKEVRIASEVLGEEGDTRNVSTIEIVLEKAA
jgi:archaea-specific DNA-binding protein